MKLVIANHRAYTHFTACGPSDIIRIFSVLCNFSLTTKSKAVPLYTMEVLGGRRGIAHTYF
jgi:hypothetical protein